MKFSNCLANLTFLQQVLLLIIIMNFLISQSFVSIMKGITVLDQTYMNTSHQLIFNRETQRQLHYYSRMYQLDFNILDGIRALYNYVQATNHAVNKDLFQECSWRRNWDKYNYKTQFCYGSKKDPSQDANFKNVLTLISLLNQYKLLLTLDIVIDVYYVSLMPEVLGFQFPASAFKEQYIYYSPFVNSKSEFIPPFIPIANISMTMIAFRKLKNKDGSIEGRIMTNFYLNKILKAENINYYLATESGMILVRKVLYTSLTAPYIYNQSITGFNYHDWTLIKNQSQSLVYNTIFKQQIQVVNIYFSEFKLYVILCKNTTNDQIQLQTLNTKFDQYYQYMFLESHFRLGLLSIFLLIVVLITTRRMLKPLEQIIYLLQMNWTKQNVEQQKFLYLISFKTIYDQKYSVFRDFVKSLNEYSQSNKSTPFSPQEEHPRLNTNTKINEIQRKLNRIVVQQILDRQTKYYLFMISRPEQQCI